jgi:uncharacterized protein HemY
LNQRKGKAENRSRGGGRGKVRVRESAPKVAAPKTSRSFRWFVVAGLGAIALLAIWLNSNQRWVAGQRQELLVACELARSRGDWIELEKLARQWAILEPERVEPWSLAAAAARGMGELESCAAYLSNLPDSAPAEAFHELSLLQLDVLQDPQAALATLERIIKLYPQDVTASLRMMSIDAMLCQRHRVRDEALQAISQKRDALATYAYLLSWPWLTFNNGYALNQQWLAAHPQAEELFGIAAAAHLLFGRDEAMSQGEVASQLGVPQDLDRRKLLENLLREYPASPELLNLKLSRLMQAGDAEELGAFLEELPKGLEKDHRFWRYRGWYHTAVQQWELAQQAYERALELCPTDWTSQNELAVILRRTQGIDEAARIQLLGREGIEIGNRILAAPNLQALPQEDYRKIADYLEQCGMVEVAGRLRRLL